MNYQKVYEDLIANAKSKARKKKQGVYFEEHHIIPKCLGGTNIKENLVLLTAKEHYIAHYLLNRIYVNNTSVLYAFWCMNISSKSQKRHTSSAITYERTRVALIRALSIRWKEDNPNNYRSAKGADNPMYGTARTGESNPFYGKKHSAETKKKISDAAKKRTGSNLHNKKSLIINDIYFESLQQASIFFSVSNATIFKRVNSNQHSNYSYVKFNTIEG